MTFPIDVTGLIHDSLRTSQREPDGLLHASGDLVGSLRHSQLALAGAPEVERGIAQDIRLETGTMWHRRFAAALVDKGIPFMQEVRLNEWLPEGWGGTADWIFFDPAEGGWVLGDLKTTKGEAMEWLERDGAKEAHIWQASAYWYALLDMGLPMLNRFAIFYVPMNDVGGKVIEPIEMEVAPLERDELHAEMAYRWERGKRYLDALYPSIILPDTEPDLLNEELEPEQERVQKMYWNKASQTFEVKLVPHWSAAFCPYEPPLCSCSQQGTTKIGEWKMVASGMDVGPTHLMEWDARSGYDIEPEVRPGPHDFSKKGIPA